MRVSISVICLSVGIVVLGVSAQAQDMTFGEFEYENSCVACHGASGNGDGPVSDFLSGAVPTDLTVMQKNNGGVFPVIAVYDTIEGSMLPSAHGSRDMPIWGNRFRERMTKGNEDDFFAFSSSETESYVNARILALIEYLASLQVQ